MSLPSLHFRTSLNLDNISKTAKMVKGERKQFLILTSYVIKFGQRTFFFIIELVFRGKREFHLFNYNAIFKNRALLK